MKDYLLFIDIEASGLPKSWDVPYSEEGNWPHTVQVAWFIYTKEGQEVKREDHYIRPDGFEIAPSSIEIHSLTPEFLQAHGEARRDVMQVLQQDLQHYEPMVIGHFMEFDYHVLNADFYRENIPSPFEGLPLFCTMSASLDLTGIPGRKYLRLGDLYTLLFHKTLENQHNAVVDSGAAAECYFELRKRRVITESMIALQQQKRYSINKQPKSKTVTPKVLLWALGIIAFFLLLFYWL